MFKKFDWKAGINSQRRKNFDREKKHFAKTA